MPEWNIERTDQFIRDMKRLMKRYPREVEQMFKMLTL